MFSLLSCVSLYSALALQGSGVTVDPVAGTYQVTDSQTGWTFEGHSPSAITNVRSGTGQDGVGPYADTIFDTNAGVPATCTIRQYHVPGIRVFSFRMHYQQALAGHGQLFPNFTAFPTGFHTFSYLDTTFSAPSFGLDQTATPWLFFNDQKQGFVFSPSSNFMVSTMAGDGKTSIGEGFDSRLQQVPSGYDQSSLLVLGDSIQSSWSVWGAVLQALYSRPAVANDADTLLKYFGYWTDNGADYYYNYDVSKGYAGTLLAVRQRYAQEGIPLGYMQLDSWWYPKSIYDPTGKAGPPTKNPNLPAQTWNRFGGLLEYQASPDLFAQGLPAFHSQLGLPLATHNRWIDRTSTYHFFYNISGIGAVDPNWWNSIASYISSGGVVDYEQDWLEVIYQNSPQMASTAGVGDAFTDDMASACRAKGLDMQYCMGTPRFFLQGVKYPNLTTIRTSGDRFESSKWSNFLYTSQFAQCVGIYPWCDVFKSGETANMILSVLSAGPVGTGDAIGNEVKANILKAVRSDGVIVKPDRPLLPCDQTYLDEATQAGNPFTAATWTDHNGLKSLYLFAFPRPNGSNTAHFDLSALGATGQLYVYDFVSNSGAVTQASLGVDRAIGPDGYAYLEAVPLTALGIGIVGDLDQFVPTGKARISMIQPTRGGLTVQVQFAQGEQSANIGAFSRPLAKVSATRGTATAQGHGGLFIVQVTPDATGVAEFNVVALTQ